MNGLRPGAVVPMKSFTAALGTTQFSYRSPGKGKTYVFILLGIDDGITSFDPEAALNALGWTQATEKAE